MDITNDQISEFFDLYYSPLDEDMMRFRAVNEEEKVPLILRETEGLLSILLKTKKPKRILEIGTAYGYSAIFFAKTCPNAEIITIDRSPKMISNARKTFDTYSEGKRIRFITGDASDKLNELISESIKFDFVFIDAGKSHYKNFFEKAEIMCNPGAIIVCDNILMRGWTVNSKAEIGRRHRTNAKYLRQFIEYLSLRKDLDVTFSKSGDGLAIIRIPDQRDNI